LEIRDSEVASKKVGEVPSQTVEGPFQPVDQDLKAVLRHSYIKPLVLWLLGRRSGYILAQESNSNWESAMTVEFFIQATDIFRRHGEEEEICQSLEDICPRVCRWLVNNCIVLSEDHCSWEKVTWDTAVVVRTLLVCLNRFSSSFTEQEKDNIQKIAKQAMKWLNYRFTAWEREVKYPFGPADVAQILITSLYIKRNHPGLFRELKVFLEQLHSGIVNYLLIEAATAVETRLENGTTEKALWWGDYFQTAEVLESLALYYNDVRSQSDDSMARVEKAIFDACTYIEGTQEDGMWGTHVDTIRTLYTYVRVSALVSKVSCQPHLTFKALRWICDEKQHLADGSFLHTMFLTIFMAPALVAVHDDWPLASQPVIQIYDEALWTSPVQISVERLRHFEAETRVSALQKDLDSLKERLSFWRKLVYSILLTATMLGVMIWIGQWSSSFTTNIILVNLGDFLKILPGVIAVYVALLIAIWRRGS